MKLSLSLVLLLLLPNLAIAQIQRGNDEMGIFFDPNGDSAGINVPAAAPFFAYVLLIWPTQPSVEGYEFGYDHWVPPGQEGLVIRLSATLPGGDIYINPPTDPLRGSYQVGLSTPIPATPEVVLLTWQYMLAGPTIMHMYLTEAENPTLPGGFPVYWGPDGEMSTRYAATCFGTGARVNENCPLPVEKHTWGTLKGLYR
jgi:hypothetical protein